MILICVGDDGDVHFFKNVLTYDCLTYEDLENVWEDLKTWNPSLEDKPTFTKEEMDTIKYRLGKFDNMADINDLRWIVKDVISERK